jgi:CRP-like cAMP-binding protein
VINLLCVAFLSAPHPVQAKRWIQSRADYGSLLVVSFSILEKLSKGSKFKNLYIQHQFCHTFVRRLIDLRDAEKQLQTIRAISRGQFFNLLTSEVFEQQLVILSTIYNLCTEHAHRITLVEQGVAKAVVDIASPNLSIQTICLQILNALSFTAGNTEETIVKDGALGLIVHNLRDGFGDNLFLALCVLSNLAFVAPNCKAIIDCGCLPSLTNIMRRGNDRERLKAIDVLRNLAAGPLEERLIWAATRAFGQRTDEDNQPYEHRLRSLLALRSLARFEQSLKPFKEFGILDLAITLLDGSDVRLCTQALGLLVNILGNTAIPPVDSQDDDDSDSEVEVLADPQKTLEKMSGAGVMDQSPEATQPSGVKQESNTSGRFVRRALDVMQRRVSPWLKLLADSELQVLAISCKYIEYDLGATLTREGDCRDCMFLVVQGGFSVLMHSIPNRRNSIAVEEGSTVNTTLLNALPVQGPSLMAKPGLILPQKKGNPVEIMRLRSGETTNEQSLLDGKPSEATIIAFKNSVVLEVHAEMLVSLLSSRADMEGLISPGEKAMMTLQQQLKKLWGHLSKGSELVDTLNISRVELGHTRLKVHKFLLQNGVLVSKILFRCFDLFLCHL